jgi:hypothetical protein
MTANGPLVWAVSLLPIPALLAQVAILKQSWLQKTVKVVFNTEISGETVTLARF